MKVFSIFGLSRSGKTTTAEYVIQELRQRGFSVGSVKDIHNEAFAIDTEGTNTHRHRMAGSQLVTARGLSETDLLFQERLPIEKILKVNQEFYDFDYVVLEGENEFNGPGIVTGHDLEGVDFKWDKSNIQVFAVSGRISAEIKEHRGVPAIDAMTEAGRLADLIVAAVPEWIFEAPRQD